MINNQHNILKNRLLLYFVGLYITSLIITATMFHRMVILGSIIEPGGILVFPLMYYFGDLIAEVYGYHTAKKLVLVAFSSDLFFSVATAAIANMSAPTNAMHLEAYRTVFTPLPKLFLISSISMSVSAFFNIKLVSKWRVMVRGKYFALRSIGASSIGELILSAISIPLIFYHQLSLLESLKIASSVLLFKIFYSVLISVPGTMLVKWVKLVERNDMCSSNNTSSYMKEMRRSFKLG